MTGNLGRRSAPAIRLAAGSIALALSPAVAGVLAARSLGPDGRGELAVALAVATIAGSIGMRGFDVAIMSVDRRDLDDRAAVSLIGRRAGRVLVVEGPVAAAVAAIVLRSLPPVLLISVVAMSALSTAFLLLRALNLRSSLNRRVLASDCTVAASSLAAAIVAAARDAPAGGYVVAACLGLVVGCAVGLTGREVPAAAHPSTSAEVVSGQQLEQSLAPVAGPAWKARVFQTASFRLDRVVLAAVGGVATAGVYAAVLPIAEMTTIVQLHLTQLVNAQIADADGGRRWGSLSLSRLAIGSSALLVAAVIVAAPQLIDLIYGPEFAGGVTALRILAVASLISLLWRLAEAELFGRRAPTGAVRATVVAAVLTVGGTALLGGIGPAAASVASLVGYSAALAVVLVSLREVRRA